MARRTDTTSTRRIVKKATVISVLKVLPTTMVRAVIAKRAADVGDKRARLRAMAHVAMLMKVRAACVAKGHPAVTAHHEMPTKAPAIGVQTARRAAKDHPLKMALAANTIMETGHPIRQVPVPIRKKATTRPTPLCNSLSLAPGPASLGPSQHGTGLLQLSCCLGAIVPINLPLPADFPQNVEVPS